MTAHPSIFRLGCVALAISAVTVGCGSPGDANGPGGPGGGPGSAGNGRVVMAWTLGGATLTQATCQKDGIAYMEVEVDSLNSDANLAYTQVQCDLDRYSLVMTPEGQVLLRVGAIVNAPNGGTCLRYYGEATATAGTTFSQTPTQVALQPVTRGGC